MGCILSNISEIFSCLGVFYMQSQKPVAHTCYVFWCRELNFLSHKSQLPRYTTFVKFKNRSPWIWRGMRANQYYMLLLEAIEWQVFSVKHWESDTSLNGVSVSQHLAKCLIFKFHNVIFLAPSNVHSGHAFDICNAYWFGSVFLSPFSHSLQASVYKAGPNGVSIFDLQTW